MEMYFENRIEKRFYPERSLTEYLWTHYRNKLNFKILTKLEWCVIQVDLALLCIAHCQHLQNPYFFFARKCGDNESSYRNLSKMLVEMVQTI